MEKFNILSGLPGYGELPEQFSSSGMGEHSEGFVVRFFGSGDQASWVGNFQRGLTQLDAALEHPGGSSVVVVAGGECYVVDVGNRSLIDTFGGTFETLIRVPEKNIIVFGSSIHFEAIGTSGRTWRSGRISWDGIRSLKLEGSTLKGEAWSYEDIWLPFALDVNSGECKGGAEAAW
jgi:hypothetical protein